MITCIVFLVIVVLPTMVRLYVERRELNNFQNLVDEYERRIHRG